MSPAGIRTILLLSNDRRFYEYLRAFANSIGLLVVRAGQSAGIDSILRATRPVAVLLDVDSPGPTAWEVAERLLVEPDCPVVILLSGRTAESEMRTALRGGCSEAHEDSTPTAVEPAAPSAVQRVLLGWLGASQWANSTSPTNRHWGINE